MLYRWLCVNGLGGGGMNSWLEKAERERDLRQAATRHADHVAQQASGPPVVPLPSMARS
jgi:hypothetical protein